MKYKHFPLIRRLYTKGLNNYIIIIAMMDYFLGIIKSLIIINKQFGWEFSCWPNIACYKSTAGIFFEE